MKMPSIVWAFSLVLAPQVLTRGLITIKMCHGDAASPGWSRHRVPWPAPKGNYRTLWRPFSFGGSARII